MSETSARRVATAVAHPNLALIKYWGKRDRALNLPATGSLSVTMAAFTTTSRVEFLDEPGPDSIVINGREADGGSMTRIASFLDLVRSEAGLDAAARIDSSNDFPTAAGLASSSSAFAAMAVAACEATGLSPSTRELSLLARRGSGSAARSVYGGFVEMGPGSRSDGADAVAEPLAPEEHWDLRIVVALTDRGCKRVGSTEGMELTAATSPYYPAWVETSEADLDRARSAVRSRDLVELGDVAEHSALKMHAACMAARPGLVYWRGGTVEAIHAVREMRAAGHVAYFTIDAGPHVKVLCTADSVAPVEERLRRIQGVEEIFVSDVGGPARVVPAPEST